MKTKIFLLQIVSACIILSVQAQKPASSFTISAGISSAAYTTDDESGKSYSSDFNTGACGGITLRLPTGTHWAVEPGLFYVQKGGAENVYGSDVKTALNYLEAPVNMYYRKTNRFFLSFRPTFGCGMSGKMKAEGESEKIKFGSGSEDDLKGFEFGLDFTAGFQFKNNLFIALTTASGINDLSNDDSYEFTNSYVGIRLGYVFPKKTKKDTDSK